MNINSGSDRSRSCALDPAAERLLAALRSRGADAVVNPLDRSCVVVRRGGKTVSLGGGAYPLRAAERLVGQGLARWCDRGAARGLVLTAAEPAGGDAGAGEAPARSVAPALLKTHAGDEAVAVNQAESPLSWLRSRRGREGEPLIDAACFEAGERLRRDLTIAGLLPGVSLNWDRLGAGARPCGSPSAPLNPTEALIAARQRVRAAFQALGPDDTDLLIDLCGFLKGLTTIERERSWPSRSAKVVAARALARLADHYGYGREARGPERGNGLRVWRAVLEDAR